MWLMVSSLSPRNIQLLFCCVLSILALILLVLMALICASISRDSVSLLQFPFLSSVQVFSCKMTFICHLKRPQSCFSSHFSSYCHSVGHPVVSIIFDGWSQSSFQFFYVVLKSSYRCVSIVFNVGKSSSFLFLNRYNLSTSSMGCSALCMVISFPVLWSICLVLLWSTSQSPPNI